MNMQHWMSSRRSSSSSKHHAFIFTENIMNIYNHHFECRHNLSSFLKSHDLSTFSYNKNIHNIVSVTVYDDKCFAPENWAASWQNQQNGMCAQRRHRSAWASAQSDQSSLSAWRNLRHVRYYANHWAHSEYSDQTGRMPRLIWVFAGHTCQFVCFIIMWWLKLRLKSTVVSSLIWNLKSHDLLTFSN